jgi:hypothetical protein
MPPAARQLQRLLYVTLHQLQRFGRELFVSAVTKVDKKLHRWGRQSYNLNYTTATGVEAFEDLNLVVHDKR